MYSNRIRDEKTQFKIKNSLFYHKNIIECKILHYNFFFTDKCAILSKKYDLRGKERRIL